jgi:hypothetical protein
MLRNAPDLARHVQELIICPDFVSENETPGFEESGHWCSIISQLVAESAKHMDALRSCIWNAAVSLPNESMWAELRRW